MEERTKAIMAALSGALAALAEDYGMILLLGCAFILLDLVTGLAKANLKPGDIVRFYTTNDEHSIFVTAVSGDTVTYGDCNADLHCGIRWGATTTKTYLRKTGVFKKIFSAPFALK